MNDSSDKNINSKGAAQNTYDAIVIGSGISGGWAAKELCEKGLKTLVLERGRNVEHIKDYTTAMTPPWGFPHRDELPLKIIEDNPIAARCYAFNEGTEQFFVKDIEKYSKRVKNDFRLFYIFLKEIVFFQKYAKSSQTVVRVIFLFLLLFFLISLKVDFSTISKVFLCVFFSLAQKTKRTLEYLLVQQKLHNIEGNKNKLNIRI